MVSLLVWPFIEPIVEMEAVQRSDINVTDAPTQLSAINALSTEELQSLIIALDHHEPELAIEGTGRELDAPGA